MANTQYKFKKSTFSYSGTSEVVAGSDKIENGDIVIALDDKNSPQTARMYVKNPFGAAYGTDGDLFSIGTDVDSLTTTKGVEVGTHLRVKGTSKFDGEIDTDSTIKLTDQQANKSNDITSNSISFTGQSNDNAATISSDKSLTFNADGYNIVMGSSGIRLYNSSESILFEGDTSNAAAKLTAGNGLWVGTGYASIEMPDSDPCVNINGDTSISGTLNVSSDISAALGGISSILTNSVTYSANISRDTYKLHFGKESAQSDYPEISFSFKSGESDTENKLITMGYHEEGGVIYGSIGCYGTITTTGGAGFSTSQGYHLWNGQQHSSFTNSDGLIISVPNGSRTAAYIAPNGNIYAEGSLIANEVNSENGNITSGGYIYSTNTISSGEAFSVNLITNVTHYFPSSGEISVNKSGLYLVDYTYNNSTYSALLHVSRRMESFVDAVDNIKIKSNSGTISIGGSGVLVAAILLFEFTTQ